MSIESNCTALDFFASADGHFNGASSGYLVGVNPKADEEFGIYKIVEDNCSGYG